MRLLKKVAVLILVLACLLQLLPAGLAFAADDTPQEPVERLRPSEDSEKPIGYNEFDENYIDLKWDPVKIAPGATSTYLNFYLQEVNKPYKPAKTEILKERDVAGTSTTLRMKGLKNSGTIYYTYAKAYHTHTVGETTITSPESAASNTVKFLTDINIEAYSSGPKQIKIVWDDVWDAGRRIDYKVYVSENSDFSGTPPIYIGQNNIGPNGPVKVNEASGKLEYVYNVRDAGRVYYVKVEPDISDTVLKRSESSEIKKVASFILVKTSRISKTDFGTIWRLDWTPVVTGLNTSEINVTYQIYRGNSLQSNDIPQYIAAVADTSYFITVPDGEENYYYLIRAMVTKNNAPVYTDVRIESDRIRVRESDVSAVPPMPEIISEVKNSIGDTVESYAGSLHSDSATIYWRPQLKNNEVDGDVRYDIWLVTDPDIINNPPDSMKIETDFQPGSQDRVMEGAKVLSYKYKLDDLLPNTTYYFKIVAKKSFIEYVEDSLESIEYISDPALKVVITPADGPIDQPVTPAKPPLAVKRDQLGRDMITASGVTIQLKNKWYEHYENGVWNYTLPEDINAAILSQLEAGTPVADYRIVRYDSGVTFDVGCLPYQNGMDYEDIRTLPTTKVRGFPSVANDPLEIADDNPDNKKHNVDILLDGLEPNTTYILWVRASRQSAGKTSEPSEPIIITTNPDVEVPLEKPTVPVINYSNAGDVYVDLGWNFKFDSDYNYYIKYSTFDNINTAVGSIQTGSDEIMASGKSYFKIQGLKPDTVYYFWIRAEAVSASGETKSSEWSDSYLVKTLPELLPDVPVGFGIKNSQDSVTKDSITYEWVPIPGMEYILEIADNPNYTGSKEYNAQSASEYTASNLRSNFRYYARLYTFDPAKKLRSLPTQTVVCRTERSTDDYDSNEDAESIIGGEYIIKDPLIIDRTWSIKITGVNADRFIEHMQTDNILDYAIDLSTAPPGAEKISIIISSKVFGALASLNENLIIRTPANTLIFRPGTLSSVYSAYFPEKSSYEYEINIKYTGIKPLNTTNLNLKTPVSEMTVDAKSGGSAIPVTAYGKPLKVVYSYSHKAWYNEGKTAGYAYDVLSSSWKKLPSAASYNNDESKGMLSFQVYKPSQVAVGEQGSNYYDDIASSWAYDSIVNVASVHELKSVSGRKFDPDSLATGSDVIKLMLDVLDIEYGSKHIDLAVKSGIIKSADVGKAGNDVTREVVIAMAVRVYELKSGEKAKPSSNFSAIYKDLKNVNPALLEEVKFGIQNGIATSRFSDMLGPADNITRGEVMVILERVLEAAGEL